jgi:hypothetical protein
MNSVNLSEEKHAVIDEGQDGLAKGGNRAALGGAECFA